ncbi:hypothetical protein FB451DRAFT_1403938 [Mycena latifolia]|nr:hypothetical protein FB451DRAFT_1403938 [Mycena latifolia]
MALTDHETGFEEAISLSLVLPPLPALRSVELRVPFHSQAIIIFLANTLSHILTSKSSPVLGRILITLLPNSFYRPPFVLDADRVGRMAALDRALAVHPAAPRIYWRLGFREQDVRAASLDDFVAKMQSWLPNVYQEGRLVIESYVEQNGGQVNAQPYAV